MELIRVYYFCARHGCMHLRRGRYVREFRTRTGRPVLLYFDLDRDGFRHATEPTILRSSRRRVRRPRRLIETAAALR